MSPCSKPKRRRAGDIAQAQAPKEHPPRPRRRTNRERPAAPCRTGDTATVRVIPPSREAARIRVYATTRQSGPWRRFRFRASAPAAPAPAGPGDGPGRAPGTAPSTTELDAS
jgi:hypothetical protein